ncbi:hypothetical protein CHUAL_013971 [Chamberlinius hualienensis]
MALRLIFRQNLKINQISTRYFLSFDGLTNKNALSAFRPTFNVPNRPITLFNRNENGSKFGRLMRAGIIFGGAVVLGYYAGEISTIAATESPIRIAPSRSVVFNQDNRGLKLLLYQYQTCPFCCKVRAFLDYNGISYDIIEVDPVMRQQIKFSKWRKVPILMVKDSEKGEFQYSIWINE